MGQTLSTPATNKTTDSGGDNRFLYAVSEMQGWRITMEDAHAVVLDLDGSQQDSNTFFAVYDGHGGGAVAKYAGQNVHKRLVGEETYQNKQYEAALKRAFLGTDEDILADPGHVRDPSGCTAVAVLVTNDQRIYVANAGDSRSVLSVKGEVKPLSFDHKPSNEIERSRISAAGGFVDCGRVNGNLALSRALGDFDFKKNISMIPEKQIITADPDVTVHDITEEDEFLVIACDGIWDCLSSQQVVDFVRLHVSQGKELSEIGELMCDHCLAPDTNSNAGIGCDNMTILIVALLHGRTKEGWYAWIKDRAEQGYGYETPSTVPQLYAMSRLLAFQARREAQKERERANLERQQNERQQNEDSDFDGPDAGGNRFLSVFPRLMGGTGGISFHPDSQIISDSGQLMFVNNVDSDDDDDDDGIDMADSEGGRGRNESGVYGLRHFGDMSFARSVALGLGSLKSCLDDLDRDLDFGDGGVGTADHHERAGDINGFFGGDGDGDAHIEELDGPEFSEVHHDDDIEEDSGTDDVIDVDSDDDESRDGGNTVKPAVNGLQHDAVESSPKSLPNGDVKMTEQSIVGGDDSSLSPKKEGFLDASENPFKA